MESRYIKAVETRKRNGSYIPWNKGKKLNEEQKKKLKGHIPWIKGKHISEWQKYRISLSLKGKPKFQTIVN